NLYTLHAVRPLHSTPTTATPPTRCTSPAAVRCPRWTGSNVPPRIPIMWRGSPAGIVKELDVADADRLPTASPVPCQRLIQAPPVEGPLKACQGLRVSQVGHSQQALELGARHGEAALLRNDRERLCRGRPPIHLQRRQGFGELFAGGFFERSGCRPEQVLHSLTGGGRDGKRTSAEANQALTEGQHLAGVGQRVHLVDRNQLRTAGHSRG